MRTLIEKILAGVQSSLPQHLLTAWTYRLMRVETRWFKNLQIRVIAAMAGVDWNEAPSRKPGDYPTFNAFFTRALKAGARAFDPAPEALCCPCDGRVSESGRIDANQLLQAKGQKYALQALLANDAACPQWENGHFYTLYLSPRDYHRVHMPLTGVLQGMRYVPGRLFSVAPYTVRQVDGLFARNERVISIFETAVGPVALVLVGAMLVAGMETVWAGEITPASLREVRTTDYQGQGLTLAKGAEMGRFNMGSTVILLLPPGAIDRAPPLRPGDAVRLGQRLASLNLALQDRNGD
jgi:phosphatidylserine decarboxylase